VDCILWHETDIVANFSDSFIHTACLQLWDANGKSPDRSDKKPNGGDYGRGDISSDP
jgi:hypothetical protein